MFLLTARCPFSMLAGDLSHNEVSRFIFGSRGDLGEHGIQPDSLGFDEIDAVLIPGRPTFRFVELELHADSPPNVRAVVMNEDPVALCGGARRLGRRGPVDYLEQHTRKSCCATADSNPMSPPLRTEHIIADKHVELLRYPAA